MRNVSELHPHIVIAPSVDDGRVAAKRLGERCEVCADVLLRQHTGHLATHAQEGGRPAFRMRVVLAGALSPSHDVYSGYELYENAALPYSEAHADSEKYQIKLRNCEQPGNIDDPIRRLNEPRPDNAALQQLSNLEFLDADNPNLLAHVKASPNGDNIVIIVVDLVPHHGQRGAVHVPTRFVRREASAGHFDWSEENDVYLEPALQPAHLLRVASL